MKSSISAAVIAALASAALWTPHAAALSVPDEPPPPRVATPPALTRASPLASPWSTSPPRASTESRAEKGPPRRAATRAQFGKERPTAEVRRIADWVVRSHDNRRMPFIILDKKAAKLYLFDDGGTLKGASPVLLGLARGDHSVPGIGERAIKDIRPHERTTPAGRFVAVRGRNLTGEDIIWVSYEEAVSIHRVRTTKKEERRLQRLASATAADNRISYGCINVPERFFDSVYDAVRAHGKAIVYVLPETQPAKVYFGA
jgi:hypothetical protein